MSQEENNLKDNKLKEILDEQKHQLRRRKKPESSSDFHHLKKELAFWKSR